MRHYRSKIVGLVLLAVGFGLLVTSPHEFSLVLFIAGLACLVPGALLCSGFLGTDPVVARMRDEAWRTSSQPHRDTRGVPERTFRYSMPAWKRLLLTLFGVCMGLGMFVAGCVLLSVLPVPLLVRAPLAVPLCVLGVFVLWVIRRQRQAYVKISPDGVEACLLFRIVCMRWDEIVSLTARQIVVNGTPTTIVYSVYSQDGKLYFTDRLDGVKDLIATLSAITGIQWQ